MRKKVVIWFIALFTLLLAFGVGHHSLICFGVKSYLSLRLPKGKKLEFAYEKSRWEEGEFVLQGTTLQREGSFDVKVDDLRVTFDFQLFPFRFAPKVIMDRPQIALMGGFGQTKKKRGLYKTLNKYFFGTPLQIRGGTFRIGEETAFIELDQGVLELSQDREKPSFVMSFFKEGKELRFDLNLEELETCWAFEVGRFFAPGLDPAMGVKQGVLNGNLSLALSPHSHIEYVKYDLDLSDFAMSHETYGLEMSLQHLGWKEHFTSNQEMGQLEAHPFFDKVWPYFVGDGEVTGMRVLFGHWAAADVSGSLRFSSINEPLVEFHGIFHQGGNETPFHLIGEGAIEDEALWKVAFNAHLFSKEKSETFFSLASKGHGQFQLDAAWENIEAGQVTLFQHLAGMHLPLLKDIAIEEGTFSGKGEGWIERKVLKRFQLHHFKVDHLKGSSKEVALRANSIEGKGEFDFLTADFFDGTFWDLAVSGGELSTPQGKIEEIELALSMHDQYIKPSTLTCRYEGIEAKSSFEGLYSHLSVKAAIASELADVDFEAKFRRFDHRLVLEGLATFLEERDQIEFGVNWDVSKIHAGQYLEALELGWFTGKEISAKTVNIPLVAWNRGFRGEGKLDIEGTFNSRAIEFSLDPTHLTYRSESVDIIPQSTTKVANCTFFFDFQEGAWRGKIPLQGVRLKEHSFGLELESFTSEVDLEGTEFLFQNVDAFGDGVHFQAEITLDFSFDDRNLLKINTYAIDGEAEDVLTFLSHFETFNGLDLPLKGKITSGPGEMHLAAYVGDVEELLEWRIALHLGEGTYPFSPTLGFEHLAGDLYYSAEDELFKIKEVEGNLTLTAGEAPRKYQLNVPLLELDAIKGVLNYDFRLEAPTHEICRIVGRGEKEEKEFCLSFDFDKTRLFGAQVDVKRLTFEEGATLSRADISTTLSALDLVHHLDFLNSAGILKVKGLHEMRGPHVEGEMSAQFLYDREGETFSFNVESSRLKMGPIDLDHLAIDGAREKDRFDLRQFEVGSLKILAQMEKEEKRWHLPELEMTWENSFLKGESAYFDEEGKYFKLPLKQMGIDMEEVSALFPHTDFDWSYLSGTFFAAGEVVFDFSKGLRGWTFDSQLKVVGKDFGKGKLHIESPEVLHLSFDASSGFSLSGADFNFLHPRSNQLWAKCHFDALAYRNGELSGKGATVIAPPEMVHFLGQTHALPHLSYEEERLILFDTPLRWDNQVEASFNFALGKEPFAEGTLKDGYYWIGDKAWHLSNVSFGFKEGALQLGLNSQFNEIPFALKGKLHLSPHLSSRIELQEEGSAPLVIQTRWNQNEGFFIQNIEGEVCGLDLSFHHNPKASTLDQMVLKGQLKVNVPHLAKLLPENVQKTIEEFEIGKGYELSGDVVIPKKHPEKSHFTGYLKGKRFQLMGSVMETLMSEIAIRSGHIELSHFNISDASGLFSMESIDLTQEEDKRWELQIPKLTITDFRPSRLKKIGKYPARIKPLTVQKLEGHSIRGYLGDPASFAGKGNLNFINTFKRDYNFFDIPFEILGRLGLDMGLLVPVRGSLKYMMMDGKIYLTELRESYSEGKRSKFFLSPTHQSYIDFDGNINVSIKMRQYVLLKVTEPFTLSIGGTFESPKYKLR
ncbi:hypothetical protein [Candidatus Neptunochlamydia vexilliferae]|nr:hypothetical protein [Candidatus Neptunochlamydia vexilliferae]